MSFRTIIAGVCFLLFAVHGSSLYAQESKFAFEQGYYFGVSGVYNSINGDFEDTRYYYDSSLNYTVPEIDSDVGFGVSIGRRNDFMAVEISYQRVSHDTHTTFPGVGDQTAFYNVIDLNLKFDVLARGRIRPNVLIGIGAPWLDIKNSRTDGTNKSDETFVGVSGNIGAGFQFYLTPRWFINTSAMYRWQKFKQVDNGQLSVDAMGSGMNYSVGIAYTF